MKIFSPLIVTLMAVLLGNQQLSFAQTTCNYLVWQDEFDATGAPSSEKWGYDTGGGGWGNNELQTYTSNLSNSWIENGKLFIKAVKANNSWTSARLVTRQKGDWLNGRIEVKAKLPLGKGTWPAIWMLPTDWIYGDWPKSGEIDIMEQVGYDPGVIYGTVHTEAYNHSIGTQKGGNFTQADAQTTFHVYAIEWSQTEIKWFVDDNLYFTFNNENNTYKEWPFDKRFHLILNIAIGGDWGGAQGIDPNLTQAVMEVEYVRVYQSELPTPIISGPRLNKKGEVATYQVDQIPDATYTWHLPESVEVVSGSGTNLISVKWNDAAGDILVDVQTACDSRSSAVFHVDYQFVPEGNQYPIPANNLTGTLNWIAVPGTGNQLSLSENSGDLQVDFQITAPTQNAYIYYPLNGIGDFTNHNQLDFDLQIDPANPPSNLRIDLVDVNGNVNLSSLFKLSEFASDADFHSYSFTFNPKSDGTFLLDQIREIRIYVSYGVLGRTGSGTFAVKNMRLQNGQATASVDLEFLKDLKVYPNPAWDQLTIESRKMPLQNLELYSMTGKLLWSHSLDDNYSYRLSLAPFRSGIYLLKINHQLAQKVIVF